MFIITITEITSERKTVGPEWKLTGPEGSAVYGYTPEIEKDVFVSRDVLKQEVKNIDLIAVIKAINGI